MFTAFELCLLILGLTDTFVLKVSEVVFPPIFQCSNPIWANISGEERGRPRRISMLTLRILKMRGGSVECPLWCIAPGVTLKFFCQTFCGGMWWMPLHVTDISAPIDYCNTSDTAWHKCAWMTAHLSSHSSLSFFLSSICQGPFGQTG